MDSRPLVRRLILLLMLGGVAMLVCADFLGAACPEAAEGASCGVPVPGNLTDLEDGCDHCLICQIGHGHVTTLAAERAVWIESQAASRSLTLQKPHSSSSCAGEIDHIPIATL